MRELGVTSWGDIVLGPAPGTTESEPPQPSRSPAEQEQERRESVRNIASRSSGAPVKRLGDEHR